MGRTLTGLLLLLCATVCAANTSPLVDFGDPNAANLWNEFRQLAKGKRTEPLRIMQFGDSHTAGDYFTGRLRILMQNRFGDAGIGWLPPGAITNQRSAYFKAQNRGLWQLLDSKQPSQEGVFPLGGFYQITPKGGRMEFNAKDPLAAGRWQISAWTQASGTGVWRLTLASGEQQALRANADAKNPWNLSTLETRAPNLEHFALLAPRGSAIGGLALDRLTPGVTLDAIGTNGARGSQISRWDPHAMRRQMLWRNPQLIILAYGTNEAFDFKFSSAEFESELRDTVRQLRYYAPNAALLLLSAPTSAKPTPPNASAGCPQPLAMGLLGVLDVQKRIAREERTLYWDWTAFMGGPCGATRWANRTPPLMGKDLIHLSRDGYEASAEELFRALLANIHG